MLRKVGEIILTFGDRNFPVRPNKKYFRNETGYAQEWK